MLYSVSTGGFYDRAIHGDNIPEDAVEITSESHTALLQAQSEGKRIEPDGNGFPVAVDPPAPEPVVPSRVTMRQARLALLGAGLLDNVTTAIAALPSPQKEAAQIEWEYSQEVHRDKQLVLILAPALGLNEAQLDQLFTQAATL